MSAGNNVTVNFNGNTVSLQQAISQATGQLQQFGSQAQTAGDQGMNLGSVFGTIFKPLQMLGGAFTSAVGGMASFIDHALQISTGIGLYNAFDTMIAKAKEFGTEMFGLNETMERMQTSWAFLYGTGANAQSFALAQQMADWTKKESYFFPFTRQDMLGAINAAGMATQDPALIEKYLPAIADIASVRTNMAGQPVTLQQAMYALTMANEGMSRMLKYDLKITPEDLKKYGWDEKGHDFNNLLEALTKYEQAHHLVGASKYIATHTWYGEWSSFMDRIQNFQLEAGHPMFKTLETDLNDFTSWWDSHQKQLNDFADFLGTRLGNAVSAAGQAFRDFFAGWQNGPVGWIHQAVNPDTISGDPHRRHAKQPGQNYTPTFFSEIGAAAHAAAQDVGLFFQAFFSHGAFSGDTLIQPLQQLTIWLENPAVQNGIQRIGAFLGDVQRFTVSAGIGLLEGFVHGLATTNVADSVFRLIDTLEQLVNTRDVASVLGTIGDILGKIAGITVGNGVDIITNFLRGLGSTSVDSSIMDFIDAMDRLVSINGLPDVLGQLAGIWGTIEGINLSGMAAVLSGVITGIQAALGSPEGKEALKFLSLALDMLARSLHDVSAALGPDGMKKLKDIISYLVASGVLSGVMSLALAFLTLAVGVEYVVNVFEWLAPKVEWFWEHLSPLGILVSHVTDLFNGFQTAAAGLGNTFANLDNSQLMGLMGALTGFGSQVQGWWNKLIANAYTWGVDLMQNLINGILSKMDSLRAVLAGIGVAIKGALGHSVPTEGPLKDELEWMPHMMQNLATTMLASLPLVAAASNRVAATISGPISGVVAGYAGYGGSSALSVAYGNASHTQNFYGVPDTLMRRMIAAERQRAEDAAHGNVLAPGGPAYAFGYKG